MEAAHSGLDGSPRGAVIFAAADFALLFWPAVFTGDAVFAGAAGLLVEGIAGAGMGAALNGDWLSFIALLFSPSTGNRTHQASLGYA